MDKQGALVGGLVGPIYWGWLVIDVMALEPHVRRQGLGTQLLLVWMPSSASFSAVLGPTPHSAVAGSGARKVASSPGGTTQIACGILPLRTRLLPTSVATFATSLLVATPSEHESARSS